MKTLALIDDKKEIHFNENLIKVIGEMTDDLYLTGWKSCFLNLTGREMQLDEEIKLKKMIPPTDQEIIKAGVLMRLKKLEETI